MKLNIEELMRKTGALPERDETFGKVSEMELAHLETFARLIVERCAGVCDARKDLDKEKQLLEKSRSRSGEDGELEALKFWMTVSTVNAAHTQDAAAIRNLLEAE